MKKLIFLIVLLFSFQAYSVTRLYDRSSGDIIDADKDDAEWDNTNNAINTHEADTSAHDATGGVVGVSKSQQLSNKSFSGNVPIYGAGDLLIYSTSTATTLVSSIDGATGDAILSPRTIGSAINCEVNYSAGTVTISGRDGVALSATNPCLIGIKSNSNGVVATARFTANVTFTDGASSDTDGNTLGITSGNNWGNAMPMFIGVIYDGTTPYFTLSRVPNIVSGAAASDLAQKGDIDGDGQGDTMILTTGLTLASWVNLPITQVAWLNATWTASTTSWTFAESTHTGFNKEYKKLRFLFPVGQMGASSSSILYAGGGAAPDFTDNEYSYEIDESGRVCFDVYANGDGGTDGSGGQAQMAIPYTFPSGTVTSLHSIFGRVNGATTITGAQILNGSILENTSYLELYYLDASAVRTSVTNAMFSNGARYILANFCYNAMTN